MQFPYWAKVLSNDSEGIKCEDIHSGAKFRVKGQELIENSRSADRYTRLEKVTKTGIVDILSNAHNVPFTVEFVKANGQSRTLRGKLLGVDDKNLGYIDVIDLDFPDGKSKFNMRQVDCRTIKSVTLRGIRYEVKKR